jgi:signal transduction histidine kinase/DNA-binding NarL/FixJ family response regulator
MQNKWKTWQRKSLRLKILAMAIVPMIVIQITVGTVAFFAYTKVTTDLVIRRDGELASLTAERVQNFLESSQHMGMLARELTAAGSPPGEALPLPTAGGPALLQPDKDLTVLLNAQGIVQSVSASLPADLVGQDWSGRAEFQQLLQTKKIHYSDLVTDPLMGDQLGIISATPVLDNAGTLIGVGVEFSPLASQSGSGFYQSLAQILENHEKKTLYLVDGQGKVIYYPLGQYLGQDFSNLPAIQDALAEKSGAIFTHTWTGAAAISSYAPIPGSTWSLVIDDDWGNITANMRGYQNILLGLLILGVFAPAVVVGLGIRHVTNPIEALTSAARQVAGGRFDQTIQVKTGDEIETLATQFNQMAAELCISYSVLESKVQERTAELVTATEQAKHAAAVAESANRAKSIFLANMSHELRTPLNAILGYTQLLARDPLATTDQREALETIGRSGEHLLGLINDVLTMSKIEAGRTNLEENAFDLHEQLKGLAEMFQMRANDKGLKLIVDLAPNTPQYIQADEGKLRQVLMNLLSNAIKFTQEGGLTLRVEARPAPDAKTDPEVVWLDCEVEDTGVGIAEAEIPTLFEPFVQTSSGKNSKEGTGLGLPISRQFVQLLGGQLELTSQVGRGSRFRFTVPVHLAAAEAVQTRSLQARRRVTGLETAPLAPDGKPYRLLVVEDQPANQTLMLRLLQPFGFDVRCANNGREGVEVWETWSPQLIWMDMRMPVMDGYEATRQIKARAAAENRPVVVIALTASAFEEERTAILAAGCDSFLRKPFREADIFELLAQYLGVRFTYAEPEAVSQATVEDETAFAPALQALLPALPPTWAADLHQAVTQLDADQMLAVIELLRPHAPQLADRLSLWVRNFDYEKVLTLSTQLTAPVSGAAA